jgi:4-amino-4-deoxy-L-arabinose transferase-like glycosyltransferase
MRLMAGGSLLFKRLSVSKSHALAAAGVRRGVAGAIGERPTPAPAQMTAVWLLAVLALGAVLRFYQLGNESLWSDETFSWQRAHWTLDQIWGPAARMEPNPPLYYSIQRLWLVFGDSEAALRSFSAVVGTLTIALVFLVARLLAGTGAGLLAALFLATSAIHVAYSQEARCYALLMLAATAAVWGLLVFLQSDGGLSAAPKASPDASGRNRSRLLGLAAYATGTTIALYTHNTALFLPLLANGIVFCWWVGRTHMDRRFAIEWLAANLVPFAIWLWWLPMVVAQAQSILLATRLSWVAQPSLLAAVFDAARLYGNPYLTLGTRWAQVLSPVALLGLLAVWHWRDRWPAVAALLVFILGVPLVTWLSGFVFRPIWIDRVVLWPLGIGFVLVAGGALAIRSRAARMGVIGLVMAAHGANLAAYYRQVVKPPWQQIVAEVTAALEEHDALLYLPRSVARLFAYYGRRSQLAPRDFVLVRERPVDKSGADLKALEWSITADRLYRLALRRNAPAIVSLDRLSEVVSNFERAWVIMWARRANDPGGVVMTRLQELGPVLQHRRYGWEVEVLLIALERRSSLGLKLPDDRRSAHTPLHRLPEESAGSASPGP